MPIYSYVCRACTRPFELLEGVTASKSQRRCPYCGSTRVQKTLSSFSVGSSSGGSCSTGSCPLG